MGLHNLAQWRGWVEGAENLTLESTKARKETKSVWMCGRDEAKTSHSLLIIRWVPNFRCNLLCSSKHGNANCILQDPTPSKEISWRCPGGICRLKSKHVLSKLRRDRINFLLFLDKENLQHGHCFSSSLSVILLTVRSSFSYVFVFFGKITPFQARICGISLK